MECNARLPLVPASALQQSAPSSLDLDFLARVGQENAPSLAECTSTNHAPCPRCLRVDRSSSCKTKLFNCIAGLKVARFFNPLFLLLFFSFSFHFRLFFSFQVVNFSCSVWIQTICPYSPFWRKAEWNDKDSSFVAQLLAAVPHRRMARWQWQWRWRLSSCAALLLECVAWACNNGGGVRSYSAARCES